MTPVEFALAKQRLQMQSARQRAELARHIAEAGPLLRAAERVHGGLRWLRRHPEALATGLIVAAMMRPKLWRVLWRWGRRAFIAWRLWRRAVGGTAPTRPR